MTIKSSLSQFQTALYNTLQHFSDQILGSYIEWESCSAQSSCKTFVKKILCAPGKIKPAHLICEGRGGGGSGGGALLKSQLWKNAGIQYVLTVLFWMMFGD